MTAHVMNVKLSALIIIDMQKGMTFDRLPPRNNPSAEDHIAQLLEAYRASQLTVVHIRHMSRSPKSVFYPGQIGVEAQERFKAFDTEAVFEKNVPDAFCHTGLERWLHARGINNLVIVGVSTNNSVESTVRSAGNLGFTTTVVANACFAFEQPDFGGNFRSAEDVHLMSLANLDGEYATVKSTVDVLSQLTK